MRYWSNGYGREDAPYELAASELAISKPVFYVHHVLGSDEGGFGLTPLKPYKTLQGLLENETVDCVVILLSGHIETIDSEVLIDRQMVILGEGQNAGIPECSFEFSGDGSVSVETPGCFIRNIKFSARENGSLIARLRLAESELTVEDCYFACSTTDVVAAVEIGASYDSSSDFVPDWVTIRGCSFVGDGSDERMGRAIRVLGGQGHLVEECLFDEGASEWTYGSIEVYGDSVIHIRNNTFIGGDVFINPIESRYAVLLAGNEWVGDAHIRRGELDTGHIRQFPSGLGMVGPLEISGGNLTLINAELYFVGFEGGDDENSGNRTTESLATMYPAFYGEEGSPQEWRMIVMASGHTEEYLGGYTPLKAWVFGEGPEKPNFDVDPGTTRLIWTGHAENVKFTMADTETQETKLVAMPWRAFDCDFVIADNTYVGLALANYCEMTRCSFSQSETVEVKTITGVSVDKSGTLRSCEFSMTAGYSGKTVSCVDDAIVRIEGCSFIGYHEVKAVSLLLSGGSYDARCVLIED